MFSPEIVLKFNCMDFRGKGKIFFVLLFLLSGFFVKAAETDFNVDQSYDYLSRTKVPAFLYQIGDNAYFYVEDSYYKTLDAEEIKKFSEALKNLSKEFDEVIYPKVTELFGSEWKLGIDGDRKITILLTQIKGESGGYFNSGDEYLKIQNPLSNEKEMIYLNVSYLEDEKLIKGFLAHELVHLITFNQKNKNYNVSEEIWLNELRAEMISTLLGYDDIYEGSNLQRRVRTFLEKPEDSLTEWKNLKYDYGVLNLFGQYLVEHYGLKILSDSMFSEKTGISSLNDTLKKNGYSENFSQIFSDWTVTVLINNCDLNPKYCYLNQNLKNVKILPQLNYLPLIGENTLTATNYSKNWAGNWFKFIGGQGTLKLEFIGEQNISYKVVYITQDISEKYEILSLNLSNGRGNIFIDNFGTNYDSLILVPFIQQKSSGFDGVEPFYQFMWSASIINTNSEKEQQDELIKQLLSQIDFLQKEILKVQAQIQAISIQAQAGTCQKFEKDLYFGMMNNQEVKCLQEFLKVQGEDIYPEGIISSNFLEKTRLAVIRFQEKYKSEILIPLGLEQGTGIVGFKTREKINQLLK